MGRYTGPKGRINRRLGAVIYEKAGACRALERRPNPPGMHTSRRKPTDYGLALLEKQKLKHYYGLREPTLQQYFQRAKRSPGNTGSTILMLCERRLDNVIRRAGLTKTRLQARQGLSHGHFQVNGRKVQFAGYLVRPGDIVSVKPRANLITLYSGLRSETQNETPVWLAPDNERLSITMHALPQAEDAAAPVNINTVVEFLSR